MDITDIAELSLTNKEVTSIKDVIASLVKHKDDTEWSAKTTHFAIDHIKEFENEYSGGCVKGLLGKEHFLNIVLPFHGHMEDFTTGILLFPDNVSVKEALEYYKKPDPRYTKSCFDYILLLKDQIKNKGFTSEIIIELFDGKLRHIDGLHSMIALSLLLEDSYEYKPIPVYILIR